MKKLMIAAAIVCAAAMSQAAAFNWTSSNSGQQGIIFNGDGTTKTAYAAYGTATLYMFDAATYSQSKALSDFAGSGIDTTKKVAESKLTTASKITQKQFDYGSKGDSFDFFFVALLDDSHIYISSMQEDKVFPDSGSTPLTYADLGTNSKPKALDATAGFKGAAVYAAAVPEPTSGLLLLLGVAGLALRRRRA